MEFLSFFDRDTLYYIKSALVISGGLFWVIAYLQAIRIGFSSKTYCIPFVALFLNVGWELYNTVRGFMIVGSYFLNYINAIWFILDLLIVYTFYTYGRKSSQRKPYFIWIVVGLFLTGLIINHIGAVVYTPKIGANYVGLGINIIMSILFITNFLKMKKKFTHDLIIAYSKLLGTFCLTLLLGVFGVTRLGGVDRAMLVLGIIVFTLDIYYLYLLRKSGYRFRESVNLNTINA
ncbi:hypothetical protein [Nonlabens sp. YIK11]|uniref:transmembrane-type terpene cyclase n=1 Tax=Nonlabens sp. YIK11 TaxID=1453349 RepID=UPI000A47E44C|nr:hypothetical protein [Nonlabens sp. YIK11]